MSNAFKETIADLAPPWLRGFFGLKLLRTFGAYMDLLFLRVREGVKARFPEYAPEDALGYIGTDRCLERGAAEPADNWRARLIGAIDANRNRGGGRTLLSQLAGHFDGISEPGLRLVSNKAVWHEYDWGTGETTKTNVGTNWDWDGNSARWWRGFVILSPPTPLATSYRTIDTYSNTVSGVTDSIDRAFTPTLGDLTLVAVHYRGSNGGGINVTAWDDNEGGTYTELGRAAYDDGSYPGTLIVFIRDNIFTNTTATTISVGPFWEAPSIVFSITALQGMVRGGLGAVRQRTTATHDGSSTVPETVFGRDALTENFTIGFVGSNALLSATLTPPTFWTERAEFSRNGPGSNDDSGMEVITRPSGFTGDTITWGGGLAHWCAVSIELRSGNWWTGPLEFGDPTGGEFDDGAVFGCDATEQEVQAIQRVVQRWKPANVYAARIIVTFDTSLYERTDASPPNPDGEMGDQANWSEDAAYWLGGGEE